MKVLTPKQMLHTALKVSVIEVFWSVFSCIGIEYGGIYISFRTKSECGKMRTRKTPNTNNYQAMKKTANVTCTSTSH